MMAKGSFGKGQHVQWNWGSGTGKGRIKERFEDEVERTLQGSKIKRNGSKENPAFLIEQEDGHQVLKLGSELEAAG